MTVAATAATRRPFIGFLLCLVPAWVIAVAQLTVGLRQGPALDAAVFLAIGERMRFGEMPYRDLWDHKPPLVYLIDWAARSATPWLDAWASVWVASVIATLAILALTAANLAGVRLAIRAIVLAVLALALTFSWTAFGGGYTEPWAVLGLLGAFTILRRWGSGRAALLAGVCFGAACSTSFQAAPAALGLFILVLEAPVRQRVTRTVAFVLGSAIVPGLLAAWLALGGALAAAIEILVSYNSAYTVHARSGEGPIDELGAALLIGAGLISLAVVRYLPAVRRTWLPTPGERAALLWIVAAAAFVALQARFYMHYAVIVMPALAIVAARGYEAMVEPAIPRPARLVAQGAVALGVGLAVMTAAIADPIGVNGERSRHVADWVTANTPAGAPIFVWGQAPEIYLYASRPVASRYLYVFPLELPGYAGPREFAEIVDDWSVRPPAAIIDTGSAARGVIVGAPSPDDPASAVPAPPDLRPIRDFIASRYHLATVVDGWRIFVPLDDAAALQLAHAGGHP